MSRQKTLTLKFIIRHLSLSGPAVYHCMMTSSNGNIFRVTGPLCVESKAGDAELWIFLYDRLWMSPLIKSMSNESYITIHVIASQLSGHCDVNSNRLWRHQQNVWGTGTMCKGNVLSSFMASFCHVRNKIIDVLSWRTVSALTWVFFFWCLFPRCFATWE